MSFKFISFCIAFTGTVMMMPSCGGSKDNPDNPPVIKDTTSAVINGTTIESGNNLVGLVKDSKTGKGIAGVPVSDGYTFTTTDENGVYQFKGNHYARKVYYSKPAGYETAMDSKNSPAFYSAGKVKTSGQTRNDFTLVPMSASDDNFTLVVLSDPQCRSDDKVERFTSETIPDLEAYISGGKASGEFHNPVAVTVGDLIFDNLSVWPLMQKALSDIKLTDGTYLPVYNCIGNHDHNNNESSDYKCTENFVNYFGPTDYSFNIGKAHIVVMDDVVYTGNTTSGTYPNIQYNAGFSDVQLKWLEADFANVADPAGTLLIMCCHIPFRGGASTGGSSVNTDKHYSDVLNLMKQFHEAHLMIGHTHYPQNYIHTGYVCKGGKPIYEHILGATCGAWWSCNMNVDGSPNQYGVFNIEGNTIVDDITKSTGYADSYQIRVFDGGQIYRGYTGSSNDNPYLWGLTSSESLHSTVSPYEGYFIAKVWNSDDTYWSVKLEDNGTSYNMTRVPKSVMNASSASYFYNILNKTTTTYMKTGYDYYVVKAPGGDPATETNWSVVATQVLPGGATNTYTSGTLQTDYTGY